MVNITKQEVRMEEHLRKRLELICEFCRVKPIIINGNLRTIDKTNLTYLEPHRIIINGITFLAFNYSNEIFIENLNNKIKLSELENYLKKQLISDYNELFKKEDIYDTINWRFIQHLWDIRNLCDHKKQRDPSNDEIEELINGTDKVIKTIFW